MFSQKQVREGELFFANMLQNPNNGLTELFINGVDISQVSGLDGETNSTTTILGKGASESGGVFNSVVVGSDAKGASRSVIIGHDANKADACGGYCVVIGHNRASLGVGSTSTIVGNGAASQKIGDQNCFFGGSAAENSDDSANRNLIMGTYVGGGGSSWTGSHNIWIGYGINPSGGSFSNDLRIGATGEHYSNHSPLIHGSMPNNWLRVNGQLQVGGSNDTMIYQFPTTTGTAGQQLQLDTDGKTLKWVTP